MPGRSVSALPRRVASAPSRSCALVRRLWIADKQGIGTLNRPISRIAHRPRKSDRRRLWKRPGLAALVAVVFFAAAGGWLRTRAAGEFQPVPGVGARGKEALRAKSAILAQTGGAAGNAKTVQWQPPQPTALCRVVARLVTQMMGRYHYSRHPVDDEISRQLFDDFFKRLDPNHYYFLASDIRDFESYRLVLDDLLREGEVQFAYDVYARFVQRVRERVQYARERIARPFDFSLDEVIETDRDNAPWAETRAELDELWRKRLKNQLLTAELAEAEKKKAEDQKKQQKRKDSAKGTNETAPSGKKQEAGEEKDDGAKSAQPAKEKENDPKAKSPEERILHAYELYLHRLEENEAMDIIQIYLSSLTRVYDPHSVYMAPDTEEDFDISMRLSLQGIGAVLTTEDEYVKVVGIIPGGPADKDGRLKEGDRIIAVAQEGQEPVDVVNMPLRKVVHLIRGPAGTKVYLTVIEAGKGLGSVPVVIDIVRGKVALKDQEATSSWRDLPPAPDGKPAGRALVISLPSFYCDFEARRKHEENYKSTTRDVRNLIEKAAAESPPAGLILDLRSNGGGSLDEAISLAGLFIPSGPVVQVRDSNGRVKIRKDTDERVWYDGPLVVLTNRMSASASEIVAAAIQDYHRGVIVGEGSTHGKGTVQTVFRLERAFRLSPIFSKQKPGSLKFTMAKFYRVNGGSTQKKGVTPDIVLPSFTDYMDIGEAYLPHVMPWDEIAPLEVSYAIDVSPFIEDLQRFSEQRRKADPGWQELIKDIQLFAERRKRKSLPLNRAKRIAYRREEQEWSKKLESLQVHRRRNLRKPKKKDEQEKKQVRDFMLEEAVHVLADLIRLQSQGGEEAAAVAPVPEERPERPPDEPAAAETARPQ